MRPESRARSAKTLAATRTAFNRAQRPGSGLRDRQRGTRSRRPRRSETDPQPARQQGLPVRVAGRRTDRGGSLVPAARLRGLHAGNHRLAIAGRKHSGAVDAAAHPVRSPDRGHLRKSRSQDPAFDRDGADHRPAGGHDDARGRRRPHLPDARDRLVPERSVLGQRHPAAPPDPRRPLGRTGLAGDGARLGHGQRDPHARPADRRIRPAVPGDVRDIHAQFRHLRCLSAAGAAGAYPRNRRHRGHAVDPAGSCRRRPAGPRRRRIAPDPAHHDHLQYLGVSVYLDDPDPRARGTGASRRCWSAC